MPQLSEAVKAHAQTKKVKASAVAEAKRVVRHAKDESPKPQVVTEQAAKDQVAKGQTATGEAAKPQAGTEEAPRIRSPRGTPPRGKPPSRRPPLWRVAINGIGQRGSLLIGLLPRMRPPNSRRPARTSPKSSLRSLRECAHLKCL